MCVIGYVWTCVRKLTHFKISAISNEKWEFRNIGSIHTFRPVAIKFWYSFNLLQWGVNYSNLLYTFDETSSHLLLVEITEFKCVGRYGFIFRKRQLAWHEECKNIKLGPSFTLCISVRYMLQLLQYVGKTQSVLLNMLTKHNLFWKILYVS